MLSFFVEGGFNMNKKIVSGILALIFSIGTINLHASLTGKAVLIRQKVKNSIEKITLKDVLTYTALVGVGVTLIVGWKHQKELREIRKIWDKNLREIRSLIKPFESDVAAMRGNLIAQQTLHKTIVALRNSGLYPRTEIMEEKDDKIITQTIFSIEDQLVRMWQQINQIQGQLNKLYQQVDQSNNQIQPSVKSQESPQSNQSKNPEGQKPRRKKGKNKVS